MHYIFVVNDIKNSKMSLTSEEIVRTLFEKKYWLFNGKYPILHRVKKLRKEDKILLYMAGINRKCIYASFTIAGEGSYINDIDGLDEFYKLFTSALPIKDIKVFTKPVLISELIYQLDFINNKTYWGLFFRQSIKTISEKDYNTINDEAQKKEQ
ncbi:EVE domain-containing protein [Bacillus sp. DJP31]|uniref:EVE domain-containing protein n=1 Tax=Bacillus sp. DJP31 TaxID=3409789 RepID=UPI003BB4D6C5